MVTTMRASVNEHGVRRSTRGRPNRPGERSWLLYNRPVILNEGERAALFFDPLRCVAEKAASAVNEGYA